MRFPASSSWFAEAAWSRGQRRHSSVRSVKCEAEPLPHRRAGSRKPPGSIAARRCHGVVPSAKCEAEPLPRRRAGSPKQCWLSLHDTSMSRTTGGYVRSRGAPAGRTTDRPAALAAFGTRDDRSCHIIVHAVRPSPGQTPRHAAERSVVQPDVFVQRPGAPKRGLCEGGWVPAGRTTDRSDALRGVQIVAIQRSRVKVRLKSDCVTIVIRLRSTVPHIFPARSPYERHHLEGQRQVAHG